MRTRCLLIRSLMLGLYRPSYRTLTSRGRMLCPLRRLWPYRFRERSGLLYLFVLSLISIGPYLCLVSVGGLREKPGKEGLFFLGVFQGVRSI